MNPPALEDLPAVIDPPPIAPPVRPVESVSAAAGSRLPMASQSPGVPSAKSIPIERSAKTDSLSAAASSREVVLSSPAHSQWHQHHTASGQIATQLRPVPKLDPTAEHTGHQTILVGFPWPKPHWPFVLFCSLWAIGELLSDVNLYAAWLFYIPSPVVALAGLLDTAVRWKKWGWRSARWSLLFSAPAVLMVLLVENTLVRLPTAEPTPAAVRVIHWNVMYGHMGWRNVLRNLKQESADLIVLSEVPRLGAANEQLTKEVFADGYKFIQEGDFGVLARGDVKLREGMMLANVHAVAWDWEYKGVKLSVLQMDLPSSIFSLRTPYLTALKEETSRRKPDLVVGDFNAPRRSLALRSLPDGYQHAYLRCGSGWGYTWPFPLPVYSLDHTLVSDALNCPRYELGMTAASDHSIQRFWIEPPTNGAAASGTAPNP